MALSKSTKKGIIWVTSFVFVLLGLAFVTDTFLIDDHTKLNADGTPRMWGSKVNNWVGIPLLVLGALGWLYFYFIYPKTKKVS
jgi:hypothetical protein